MNLSNQKINATKTIKEAIKKIQLNENKIVYVVDKKNVIIGTITDGDVRRGLIKGFNLQDNVTRFMNTKFSYAKFIKGKKIYKKYFNINKNQIPIINSKNQLISNDSIQDIKKNYNNEIVIMAGGYGKRLKPLTNKIPKPMLKVNGNPILELIINNFKNSGFNNFHISVNYKKDEIKKYFNKGKKFNVKIEYIEEKKPLGTAGSLKLLKKKNKLPIIITNGDVLTKVNYENLLKFHQENNSDITVAIRELNYQIQYGVLKFRNGQIISISEKPIENFHINAGVYILNPKVLKFKCLNKYCDMTDLINYALKYKKNVFGFPLYEDWIDIGNIENYNKVKNKWNEEK